MKYLTVLFILIKSFLFKKRVYNIKFIKVNRLWYCDIPNWPKAFFDNAQMVGGAARILEILAKGKNEVTLEVIFDKKYLKDRECKYNRARKLYSYLLTGAYYDVISIDYKRDMWICPVTLFVLGKYPEYIYFKTIK